MTFSLGSYHQRVMIGAFLCDGSNSNDVLEELERFGEPLCIAKL